MVSLVFAAIALPSMILELREASAYEIIVLRENVEMRNRGLIKLLFIILTLRNYFT